MNERTMTEWQPMNTAPRDGSWFMVGTPAGGTGSTGWWVGTARFEPGSDEDDPTLVLPDGSLAEPADALLWKRLPPRPNGVIIISVITEETGVKAAFRAGTHTKAPAGKDGGE